MVSVIGDFGLVLVLERAKSSKPKSVLIINFMTFEFRFGNVPRTFYLVFILSMYDVSL